MNETVAFFFFFILLLSMKCARREIKKIIKRLSGNIRSFTMRVSNEICRIIKDSLRRLLIIWNNNELRVYLVYRFFFFFFLMILRRSRNRRDKNKVVCFYKDFSRDLMNCKRFFRIHNLTDFFGIRIIIRQNSGTKLGSAVSPRKVKEKKKETG